MPNDTEVLVDWLRAIHKMLGWIAFLLGIIVAEIFLYIWRMGL